MIRKVVSFEAWHLDWLEQSGAAEGGWVSISAENRKALEQHNSWTVVVRAEIVGCGGTVEIWRGRHSAWAYLNKNSGPHMLFVTRAAKAALARAKGRIEMTTRIGFDEGRRWAFILGFHVENACLNAYGPDGEPHASYVRYN